MQAAEQWSGGIEAESRLSVRGVRRATSPRSHEVVVAIDLCFGQDRARSDVCTQMNTAKFALYRRDPRNALAELRLVDRARMERGFQTLLFRDDLATDALRIMLHLVEDRANLCRLIARGWKLTGLNCVKYVTRARIAVQLCCARKPHPGAGTQLPDLLRAEPAEPRTEIAHDTVNVAALRRSPSR